MRYAATPAAAVALAALLLASWSCRSPGPRSEVATAGAPPMLLESWNSYVDRFVQADGRVIDHKGGGISTSEGQAYAMLRAVWIDDRATFDRAFEWARNNLNAGVRTDHLWAWKWGRAPSGEWRVLDRAFASDADQDAALALILAWRSWADDAYLEHARAMLADLWELGTVQAGDHRYLLAGDSLCEDPICRINPSYYAPYAYRIFARYDDPDRDWERLVESSYLVVSAAASLTTTGLPPDWVNLDTRTGAILPAAAELSPFSYDAFRTHWRIALDRELFGEARARTFLAGSLPWLVAEWQRGGTLPASISPAGQPLAHWESPEMLSGLLPALDQQHPAIAEAVFARLQSGYAEGIWSDRDSYYIQNWAWFGTALYLGHLGVWELVMR